VTVAHQHNTFTNLFAQNAVLFF